MKITEVKAWLCHYPLPGTFFPTWIPGFPQTRNTCLIIALKTDEGIEGYTAGVGILDEAKSLVGLLRPFLVNRDPFNVEDTLKMLRSSFFLGYKAWFVEVALWDIIGKACQQPVYKLLGGDCHRRLPAYANGWYGGARTPRDYAEKAREAVGRGYRAMKFDPFGTAWKEMTPEQSEEALELVAAVREAVGPHVGLMIEFHGRLSVGCALETMHKLEPYFPAWCEEPAIPDSIDLLQEVKKQARLPIAAGERLYTLPDFYRLLSTRAVDVVQMDISHCGGLLLSKKIAAIAAVQEIRVSPHCSVGPVALAACLHFDKCTPNFMIQEAFAEFDIPWRNRLVRGWNPIKNGEFVLTDQPGLGLELDEDEIALHPYVKNSFPSLWNSEWLEKFTRDKSDQ